jgi:hypothetical protein
MPPKKGFARSPEYFRTRVGGLDRNIQKLLLVDLESNAATVHPQFIVDLRPEYDPVKRSVKDRIRYFRSLKNDNPAEYW